MAWKYSLPPRQYGWSRSHTFIHVHNIYSPTEPGGVSNLCAYNSTALVQSNICMCTEQIYIHNDWSERHYCCGSRTFLTLNPLYEVRTITVLWFFTRHNFTYGEKFTNKICVYSKHYAHTRLSDPVSVCMHELLCTCPYTHTARCKHAKFAPD